jgi:hypothetical protein
MIRLDKTLNAWGTSDFTPVLKQELAQYADQLPLQQGLSHGNYVTANPISVMINSVAETENTISIKAGIFYLGLMGGCSCADDPTPVSESNEYCEVLLDIDRTTAATSVALVT